MINPLPSDQRRAFPSAPDPRRYYAASAVEEARQRIVRSILRSEGPALVVGAVGVGKSLLLAVLAEQFEARLSVVRLPGAQLCTRRALLQMILCELRLPYRHMDEGELRLSILEHLRGPASSQPRLADEASHGVLAAKHSVPAPGRGAQPPAPPPRRMLVLVDEADALPTRLLEELRVLTNVVAHGMPLVSLVLAGSPILEERFAEPELEKFSQRLACRCYLAPLTRDETSQFVRSQVSAVGVKPEKWFDPEALAAVHAATGGVPRLVNQLGDQLVWMIEETGCQPLDAALVQQAWSDLQQLPAPWNTDAHSSLSSPPAESVGKFAPGVIEFGDLDDDFSASRAPGVPAPGVRAEEFDDEPADEHDAAAELFVGHDYRPHAPHIDLDDDLPASIPIAAGRRGRNADLGAYAASLEATEQLVDQLDEFELLELAAADPEPEPEPPPPAAAENPFAEPFAEEEILVDPYSGFESQTLRTARQVTNRVDRTFAADLARCEPLTQPAMASPSEPSPFGREQPSTVDPMSTERRAVAILAERDGEGAPKSTHAQLTAPATPLASSPGDLLIIEDDAISAAAVVPGRQFRRLFSSLEAGVPARALHG